MSLLFNGNEPDTIKFNGSDVAKVYFDSVEIWKKNKFNQIDLTTTFDLSTSNTAYLYNTIKNVVLGFRVGGQNEYSDIYIFDRESKTVTHKTANDFNAIQPATGSNKTRGDNMNNNSSYRTLSSWAGSTVDISIIKFNEISLTESLYDTQSIQKPIDFASSIQPSSCQIDNDNILYNFRYVDTSNNSKVKYYIYNITNKSIHELTLTSNINYPVLIYNYCYKANDNIIAAKSISSNDFLLTSEYVIRDNISYAPHIISFEINTLNNTINITGSPLTSISLASSNYENGFMNDDLSYTHGVGFNDGTKISGVNWNINNDELDVTLETNPFLILPESYSSYYSMTRNALIFYKLVETNNYKTSLFYT